MTEIFTLKNIKESWNILNRGACITPEIRSNANLFLIKFTVKLLNKSRKKIKK